MHHAFCHDANRSTDAHPQQAHTYSTTPRCRVHSPYTDMPLESMSAPESPEHDKKKTTAATKDQSERQHVQPTTAQASLMVDVCHFRGVVHPHQDMVAA